jgi:beta-glucosidase
MTDKTTFLSELLSRMSTQDKAGQLNLLAGDMDATGIQNATDLEARILGGKCGAVLNVYTPSATRALQEIALRSPLRIPLIFGYDVIHGHRTIFPIPLGLACSWNLELISKTARVAAEEAAADGLHWVYSPMVDISQDPRWGRVAEGAGEDPWLGSKIAAAMVKSYQGDDLSDPTAVLACVKHFALYGAPAGGRDYHTVDMSRRAMEETYFPPYRAAIDAGARTVMTAFNEIDGIPASANRWLLNGILREQWGFTGWVVTDYNAVAEMLNHGTAASAKDAARQSLDAGVDMDMMSEAFLLELPALVEAGEISEAQVDNAVMRILETKWDLGLFRDPFARCDERRAGESFPSPENRDLARQAARESIVLLKNDFQTLPLKKSGTIALIGPLAASRRDMLGCWIAAGDADSAVSPLDGMLEALEGAAVVLHAPGSGVLSSDTKMLDEALTIAHQADVVILMLGESWHMHGEAASRSDIRLPKCQRALAKAIFKTGKPCILVTLSGRPLELSREHSRFAAILHAWAPGIEGGHALADVLFGDFAPIGKLTMGFPRHVGQLPMTYREKPGGRPFDENVHYSSKYLDVRNDALYPFGHGLTYGEFTHGAVTASAGVMHPGEILKISAQITNLAGHPATETLQLYLRDRVASVTRPLKELRGFQRITLAPGESQTVTFTLTQTDLSFPGPDFDPITESGEFDAMIGPDSANVSSVRFTFVSDDAAK